MQLLAAACFALTFASVPAQAEAIRRYDIPRGNLADALITFAQQADISIAVNDPRLRTIQAEGLRGRYSVRRALRKLLRDSGYSFVLVEKSTYRLVKQEAKSPPGPRGRPSPPGNKSPPQLAPATETSRPEIVVTATKQRLGLSSYPASIAVVEFEPQETARYGSLGIDMLLREMPNLASTNLGSGRNKIFIRGIADSSFNGVSQATISQYLGDNRLIYSAPDPDLALFDVSRIEVLEGPQGTLYGAGTLGGIIRIVPGEPDTASFGAQGSAGIATTRHGGTGGDAAGTLNLPLIRDHVALRFLGYRTVSPGYVDDDLRDLSNVNRKAVTGFRATLRLIPATGWTLDLGGIMQKNRSRDAQYSEKGLDPLTRRSAIEQPYDNDYKMAFARIEKRWDGLELVSATSYTDHSIDSNFDASETPDQSEPLAYNEDMTVELIAHETRLSGNVGSDGRWVLGASALRNINIIERALGPPEELETTVNIRSRTNDVALFGETTIPLVSRLAITFGGRLAYVRQKVELVDEPAAEDFEPRRSNFRLLPTVAASWNPGHGLLAYARYQEGFRPGGLQVSSEGSSPVAQRFDADRIRTVELGLRFGTGAQARLSGALSLSYSRWTDIQADLVDAEGFPFAANIGAGRVRNLAANLVWRPMEGLSFEAAGFINSSSLSKPAPLYATAEDLDLPNVSDRGWRTSVRYDRNLGTAKLTVDTTVRYVGDSILAIGAPLNLSQGNFHEVSAGMRLALESIGISADVQNLLDKRGNRFSYGNPFSVAEGRQITPLRPRSIRIGIDFQF